MQSTTLSKAFVERDLWDLERSFLCGRRFRDLADMRAQVERWLREVVDVQNRLSVDRFRDRILERFGQVDILVNAAGQIQRKPTREVSEHDWQRILDINVVGVEHYNTARECQRVLQRYKD